jgi:RNA polymerase sigma factor (sigma-70 family)
MKKRAKSAQGPLAEWEFIVARNWVRKFRYLVKHEEEMEDLAQDVLMHWLEVRDQHDEKRALLKTFMNRVVMTRLLEIERYENANLRRINTEAKTFSTPTGEGTTIQDEADRASIRTGDDDLTSDVRQTMESLNERERSVAEQLADGMSQVKIAKNLGIHRSTVHEDVKRIRKLFIDSGLKEYIK